MLRKADCAESLVYSAVVPPLKVIRLAATRADCRAGSIRPISTQAMDATTTASKVVTRQCLGHHLFAKVTFSDGLEFRFSKTANTRSRRSAGNCQTFSAVDVSTSISSSPVPTSLRYWCRFYLRPASPSRRPILASARAVPSTSWRRQVSHPTCGPRPPLLFPATAPPAPRYLVWPRLAATRCAASAPMAARARPRLWCK